MSGVLAKPSGLTRPPQPAGDCSDGCDPPLAKGFTRPVRAVRNMVSVGRVQARSGQGFYPSARKVRLTDVLPFGRLGVYDFRSD